MSTILNVTVYDATVKNGERKLDVTERIQEYLLGLRGSASTRRNLGHLTGVGNSSSDAFYKIVIVNI